MTARNRQAAAKGRAAMRRDKIKQKQLALLVDVVNVGYGLSRASRPMFDHYVKSVRRRWTGLLSKLVAVGTMNNKYMIDVENRVEEIVDTIEQFELGWDDPDINDERAFARLREDADTVSELAAQHSNRIRLGKD